MILDREYSPSGNRAVVLNGLRLRGHFEFDKGIC